MTTERVPPRCLNNPEPTFRVFEGPKRLYASPAGYVLSPHSDYRVELEVPGIEPHEWTIRVGKRPDFIDSARLDSSREDEKAIQLSTRRAASGWWAWLTDTGADLPLTISFDDPELDDRRIVVPLMLGQSAKTGIWLVAFLFISMIGFLFSDRLPEPIQQYVPSDLATKGLAFAGLFLVALGFVMLYGCVLRPIWRSRSLTQRANERLRYSRTGIAS